MNSLDHYEKQQAYVEQLKKAKPRKERPEYRDVLSKQQIQHLFLKHGFVIKEGDDLKPYVYEAAEDLIRSVLKEIVIRKDLINVEKYGFGFPEVEEDDFPLGKACDRFDPTCESCT